MDGMVCPWSLVLGSSCLVRPLSLARPVVLRPSATRRQYGGLAPSEAGRGRPLGRPFTSPFGRAWRVQVALHAIQAGATTEGILVSWSSLLFLNDCTQHRNPVFVNRDAVVLVLLQLVQTAN